jgi:hypothetical protein
MNALEQLNTKIRQSFSASLRDSSWGAPELMSKVLGEVSAVFDSPLDPAPKRSIGRTLLNFRQSEKFLSFLDLKYTCLGITQPVGEDNWRLIEDAGLFPVLLQRVEREKHRFRRFMKCYQGLLSGYFDYNIYADDIPASGLENWEMLRSFLYGNLTVIQQAEPLPGWVKIIGKHAGLLSESLCDDYGADLAQGDYRELKSVLDGLLIPRNSWVWESTVLARIKAVCRLNDETFKKHLDQCLSLSAQDSKIALSEVLKKRCTAQLVSRYAKCSSKPEHAALFDSAVTTIGNPLINRTPWDAFVQDEDARRMINGWFKRRLIADFFTVLSEDSPADTRRLRYWLRFEARIEDIWFALGPYAYGHHGEEFRKFRTIVGDRIMKLENGGSIETNALIMLIDEYVFVEFGSRGHPCIVFKSNDLSFEQQDKWTYFGSRYSELSH